MHPRSLLGLAANDDPQQGLHRGRVHVVGRCHFAHRVGDQPILALVGRVLAQSGSAAHPHIHHHRVLVSGDGTCECVRLGAAQSIESFGLAAIRGGDMGAQSLRHDALRVLVRLRLIVRPSDAGRECGDNGRSDFHAPLGAHDAEAGSELVGLGVPTLGGVDIEQRGGCEEGAETGGVGGGGDHGSIVPDRGECV